MKSIAYNNSAKTLPNTHPTTETATVPAAPVWVAETLEDVEVEVAVAVLLELVRIPEELAPELVVLDVAVLEEEVDVEEVVDVSVLVDELRVDVDVPVLVVLLLLLLSAALETSNWADWARMPLFSDEVDTRLIW